MILNSSNSSTEEITLIIRQKIIQLSKVYTDEIYFPLGEFCDILAIVYEHNIVCNKIIKLIYVNF